MDFARKQLEKYGWTDGKGLGKHENGMAEALKPKLKRSVTGIGHDAASDFTEHWWTQLYNKAASNVEVEEKNGKTKKIKTKDPDEFEITNSTWKIKKKKKKHDKEEQYADFFVRKAVLTNGESQVEKTGDSDSEEEIGVKKDVFNMTDEELFAACEGRTAHKGARHGLKATGKLARIAQQEQILLTQSQYEGYSHAKRRKVEDKMSNEPKISEIIADETNEVPAKKQKKKKNKFSDVAESVMPLRADCEKSNSDSVASNNKNKGSSRKSKMIKCNDTANAVPKDGEVNYDSPKKKKQKSENMYNDRNSKSGFDNRENVEDTPKEAKKKKRKNLESIESS